MTKYTTTAEILADIMQYQNRYEDEINSFKRAVTRSTLRQISNFVIRLNREDYVYYKVFDIIIEKINGGMSYNELKKFVAKNCMTSKELEDSLLTAEEIETWRWVFERYFG